MIIGHHERPNAWVGPFAQLAVHIERFFRDAAGEIWVFDTPLHVLTHEEEFARFYLGTIARLGRARRIRCVKIILPSAAYGLLGAPTHVADIKPNLARYPADAPPIWVSNLADIEQRLTVPEGVAGGSWVMCVESGHLVHNNAIAVRLLGDPLPRRTAITWPISDRALISPAVRNFFNRAFTDGTGFRKLVRGREAQRRTRSLLSSSGRWEDSQAAPYKRRRILVIVALDEEIGVAMEVLGLSELGGLDGYWYADVSATNTHGDRVAYSLLVRALREMGNTDAAVQTMVGFQEFDADVVVLLGITGGVGLGPPTVVVAQNVHAYEYATVKPDGNGRWTHDREARPIRSKRGLRNGIVRAKQLWAQTGNRLRIITMPTGGATLTAADVGVNSQEKVASGAKKSKCDLFTAEVAGRDKKIKAIEMEGEGVGHAAEQMERPFLIIKGVSDNAGDDTQDDDYREAAARAAAHFLRLMLREGCL